MRTALAVLLACTLVAMTTADRVMCPDGCTDEAPAQTAPQQASSPCALCHAWSPAPILAPWRPAAAVVPDRPDGVIDPSGPALPAADPPPRLA